MRGATQGEMELLRYATSLRGFAGDVSVAEHLVRLQRSLLFRSRGLSDEFIGAALENVKHLADRHRDSAVVQSDAREAPAIAMQAIVRERAVEALSRLEDLRSLVSDSDLHGEEYQVVFAETLGVLLNETAKSFPAVALSLWLASQSVAGRASPETLVTAWSPVAIALARRLVQSDNLGAFLIWMQAVQWCNAAPAVNSDAFENVIAGAYVLIRTHADPASINQPLWGFIKTSRFTAEPSERNRESRLNSVLAAVDMAEHAYMSNREVLGRLLRAAGAVVPVSGDMYRIDHEALGNAPEALEKFNSVGAQVGEFLRQAQAWITDDVASHERWHELLGKLEKLRETSIGVHVEFREFRVAVLELTARTREAQVRAARCSVVVREAPLVEWLDRPLYPASWADVESVDEVRESVSHLSAPGGWLHNKEYVVERLRTARCIFYQEGTLFEAQVEVAGIRGIVFYVLLPQDQVAVFDGESAPIHTINAAKYLSELREANLAREYMVFFCEAVWADEGPFHVVRSVDELRFEEKPDAELVERIGAALVRQPVPYKDINGHFRMEVSIAYGRQLFKATLEATPDGQVEMIVDENVLDGDLPVRPFRKFEAMRISS
jgi:hypothetical protein